MVILDAQISDVDSMELLRTIRNTKHTPILVITTSLKPTEIATLYRTGADVCIEKPVNLDICTAQAEALILLYLAADMNLGRYSLVIHGEELIISPRCRQAMVGGKPLSLTRKEFDLFYCLARHPGQVFSREQLYNHVWGADLAVAVDEAVKTYIKRLRKKLAAVGKNYIQTEWGIGYKFVLLDCEG